jgi:ABC-type lipoprotein release transport system permease subunit
VHVAWYRFRTTIGRRWAGYVSVVLLIGMIGGLSMASIAGARRTQSSFTEFLASTNPSDLVALTGLYQPAPTGYDPGLIKKIAQLPYVTRVESEAGYEAAVVGPNGYPLTSGPSGTGPMLTLYSSVDGVYFNMDRMVVLRGRMPNPARRNEVAMTADQARLLGVRLGGTFRLGVVGDAQSVSGCSRCRPTFRTVVKLVGIVTTGGGLIVDDTDRTALIIATPAFTRPLLNCCVDPTLSFIQIAGGTRHLAAVEADIARILPPKFPREIVLTSSAAEATAQRVIRPVAVALEIFGLIVALVALVISGQVIGRQLRLGADDLEVVRALGAGPATTSVDGLVGVVGAVVVGSVFAGLVAFALSPLAPIGPVRSVYPTPGFAWDATVIGFGVLALVIVLSALAVTIGFLQAPHRVARRRGQNTARSSRVIRAATIAGLPVPAVCGIRFALVSGRGRQASPVRSAIVGAVVAVTVVVATLTVGSSLDTLVARPPLFGWNWSVALAAAGGVGVLPEKQMIQQLNHDPDVAAWSGVDFSQLQFDGLRVAVLGVNPGGAVAPPLLSGHGLDSSNQVVLGAATLAQLHKRVGDTVLVSNGATKTTTLRIVGTATMPAFGGAQHPELGTGAVLDYRLIPAASRNLFNLPGGGPNAVLVRFKAPADRATLKRLHQVTLVLEHAAQDSVEVISVQRPAEIANAGTLRATPTVLALALAAGAVMALGLTLIASVRRRRRDLALLKSLGFTQRQLAAAVAWQATVAGVIGLVVGIPLGIVSGRELWTLFAQSIHAVPDPSVPGLAVVLVGVGALVFANLVAVLPGRAAARTSAALVLRAE